MRFNDFRNILQAPKIPSILDLSPEEFKVRIYKSDAQLVGASVYDITDDEIAKIAEEVILVFQEVAEQRGEQLDENNLSFMIAFSIKAYTLKGEKAYHELVECELNKYRNTGFFKGHSKP